MCVLQVRRVLDFEHGLPEDEMLIGPGRAAAF